MTDQKVADRLAKFIWARANEGKSDDEIAIAVMQSDDEEIRRHLVQEVGDEIRYRRARGITSDDDADDVVQ